MCRGKRKHINKNLQNLGGGQLIVLFLVPALVLHPYVRPCNKESRKLPTRKSFVGKTFEGNTRGNRIDSLQEENLPLNGPKTSEGYTNNQD